MGDFRKLTESEIQTLRSAAWDVNYEWGGRDIPTDPDDCDYISWQCRTVEADDAASLAEFVQFFESYSHIHLHLHVLDVDSIFSQEELDQVLEEEADFIDAISSRTKAHYGFSVDF